jgi:DtxR family Mn-dependent transcriptional regulator
MLRYLAECGIVPGTELSVAERDPDGALLVEVEGARHSLGERLARRILVAPKRLSRAKRPSRG